MHEYFCVRIVFQYIWDERLQENSPWILPNALQYRKSIWKVFLMSQNCRSKYDYPELWTVFSGILQNFTPTGLSFKILNLSNTLKKKNDFVTHATPFSTTA